MTAPEESKQFKLTRASEITPRRVEWLAKDLLPIGTLTVVSGDSGIGKTTLVISWLAAITRGTLNGIYQGHPQNVLIFSPEDDPGAVTRPRLEAAGADLTRCHFVSATRLTSHGEIDTVASFPADIDLLEKVVKESGAAAVMLDPIASLVSGNLDKREDIRAAFDVLAARIAARYELALIVVAHNKKGFDSVRHRISGSAAITDAARSVLALARDDETEQLVLSIDKSSYSTAEGTNYAYALVSTTVNIGKNQTTEVARAVFVGESTVSVADINHRANGDDKNDDRNAAQAFVLDYLRAIDVQEAAAGAVIKAGRAAGFNDQEIKDARRRSRNPKIVSAKSGFGAGWVWRIEHEGGGQGGVGGPSSHPATYATFDATLADDFDSVGNRIDVPLEVLEAAS